MSNVTNALVLEFVTDVIGFREEVYIGIDPGAKGAIAFLCGKAYTVVDIPKFKVDVKRIKKLSKEEKLRTGKKTKTVAGSTTKFDLSGIIQIFSYLHPLKDGIIIALEEPPITKGKFKTYGDILINRAYSMWPLFLLSKRYSVIDCKPNIWKAKMGISKTKDASRHKALSFFPKADILRKMDHDRAEALLLALYIKRVRQGDFV